MPYIEQADREAIDNGRAPATPGELNYAITQKIQEYILSREFNYSVVNDVLGALEGAKLEFYRRIAVPYEDVKILANGDVY